MDSKTNFLVISNYNSDLTWLKELPNDYVVYDRSDATLPDDTLKIIKSDNSTGYNLHDYLTYIIDNYEKLPDVVTFCTGNIFPRCLTRKRFMELMNNKFFTALYDWTYEQQAAMPQCMFSSDGIWSQLNNGSGLPDASANPLKYLHTYDDLLFFCFRNPLIPKYITFAPGGNYVVPRENILKYSPVFYQNLRTLMSHCAHSGESHIIEMALHTIWMGNFEVTEEANTPIDVKNFKISRGEFEYEKIDQIIKQTEPMNQQPAIPAGSGIKVGLEIQVKDTTPPYSYIPFNKHNLLNKPDISNAFSRPVADFVALHENYKDAEEYLMGVILPNMNSNKNLEFTIVKNYSK